MDSVKNNIKLIVRGCLDKNKQSQKHFFKLYFGLIKSICNRYANKPEQADEMLNDSFYQVFKSIHTYDQDRAIEPWISGVTVKCCLMYQRKYFKNLDKEVLGYELKEEMIASTPLPEDSDDYQKLLHKLPQTYKTIINLYVIEEYKHQEIAEMLGISVGTSKSQLHRAKKLLYDMLERDSRGKLKFKSN